MKFAKLQLLRRRGVQSGRVGRIGGLLVGVFALVVGLTVPANAAIGNLGPGSSGPQVETWQDDLNFFIHTEDTCHPTLVEDGMYGDLTTDATFCFQGLLGDHQDGLEGPQTRTSMCQFLTAFNATALVRETC